MHMSIHVSVRIPILMPIPMGICRFAKDATSKKFLTDKERSFEPPTRHEMAAFEKQHAPVMAQLAAELQQRVLEEEQALQAAEENEQAEAQAQLQAEKQALRAADEVAEARAQARLRAQTARAEL